MFYIFETREEDINDSKNDSKAVEASHISLIWLHALTQPFHLKGNMDGFMNF